VGSILTTRMATKSERLLGGNSRPPQRLLRQEANGLRSKL
jgi:hypothetical protein